MPRGRLAIDHSSKCTKCPVSRVCVRLLCGKLQRLFPAMIHLSRSTPLPEGQSSVAFAAGREKKPRVKRSRVPSDFRRPHRVASSRGYLEEWSVKNPHPSLIAKSAKRGLHGRLGQVSGNRRKTSRRACLSFRRESRQARNVPPVRRMVSRVNFRVTREKKSRHSLRIAFRSEDE
jgi:hypothetical protein